MRIFLYEYASAQADSEAIAPSIRIEGQAMLACLLEDFGRLPGVEIHTLSGQRRETEQKAFREPARTCDWSLVVAPEFDNLLWQRCRWVEEERGCLLGPSSEAVRLAGDKWATYRLLQANSVPTPRTWLASVGRIGNPSDAETSLYLQKPRWGAGSQGIRFCRSSSARESSSDYLIQEYVPGQAVSVAFLIGPTQIIPLLPGFQTLSDDGCFHYLGGRLPLPLPLATRAIPLAERAARLVDGLRGYVGVDLVLGDEAGRDVVIEINPRLTTSYVGLRELAVGNLADAMLRIAAGEQREALHWQPGAVVFQANGEVRDN